MNKKPQKSWGEVQLAIAALAFTATLVLWNLFSVPQKQQLVAQSQDTTVPPMPPDPIQTQDQAPAPTQGPGFVPVKIIFGGIAPQTATQGCAIELIDSRSGQSTLACSADSATLAR